MQPVASWGGRSAILAGVCLTLVFGLATASAAGSFVTFESGQVRPLALSPDGSKLFAVNTPDDQLEIFDVGAGGLTHVGSVPVGMEPVAVAARTNNEVWVVNFLSDSVSVVDVASTPPHVARTLLVGDEPRDVVFAGPGANRAFITTAHRGQNSPVDPQLTTPGVGRADVWVFDATNLGAALGGAPLTIVTLFGDTPRALAVSPDGNTVYAAIFESGNQTTALNEGLICNGGAAAPPCTIGGRTMPGGLPAPNTNFQGLPQPQVGLIVKFNPNTNAWEDGLGRDWSNAVNFSLPDYDVFAIDATANPPVETQAFAHVGTILFNMAVNPVSGNVYVSNTDAHNEVRFEGQGIFSHGSVRGHLHEARITVIDGSQVEPRHLNKQIDYAVVPSPPGIRESSLATPMGMAVSSDGSTLYVAAFGSSAIGVFNTAELENDTFIPDPATHIAVSGGGPSGLVLDEARSRLYVLTRFDDSISTVDTVTGTEIAHVALHNPEPYTVTDGRRFLYDATFTSSNGEASCSSCHVFGDFDSLAWDLGNPDNMVLNNPNPFQLTVGENKDYQPLKGPMTTQSMRGLANDGPMHWRGDRTGGNDPGGDPLDENAAFKKFNAAFFDLIGRSGPISDEDMQKFATFALQIKYPPNPIRNLDNSLTPDQQAGHDFYFGPISDTFFNCNGCHVLDPANGNFGTAGLMSFEGETQDFKIPQLRNMYQKVGMFGMPAVNSGIAPGNNGFMGDQVRGFGFLHDGSIDTLLRFHSGSVFQFPGGDAQRAQVEQFVLAYPSDFAPIVGQQITLTDTNATTVNPRIDLLEARAAAGECDLIVKGVISGELRGAYRTSDGNFQPDRAADPPISDASLRALAATPGQDLTFTCVPPGSGLRLGVDRDGDTVFDGDERDAGTDPASALSLPPSDITCSGADLVDKAKLHVGRNALPAGDERLVLKGEWLLSNDTPAIDPVANGFRFKVDDMSGNNIFYRVVPSGDAASLRDTGWTVNKKGTKWVYRDKTGTRAGGITKVVVKRSWRRPLLFKFRVVGKNSDFRIDPARLPVQVLVVLGDHVQGVAGECASRMFNAGGGLKPLCQASRNGNSITCR